MKCKLRPGIEFLLVCLILAYGMYVIRRLEPGYTFAKYDPGWMVTTVMSIAEDGDLDLRNQLNGDPNQASDQTAQGKSGQWYPVHEYLMAFATVPFYLLMGVLGCLAFNVVVTIILMTLLYAICCRYVDQKSAFIAVILTGFSTLFYEYSYSYSVDVFGACLLAAAYFSVTTRGWVLSGFLWGLAVFARTINIATAPAFLVFIILREMRETHESLSLYRKPWKEWALGIAGFSIGVLPIMICMGWANFQMFGSPFATGYQRWQPLHDGRLVLTSLSNEFTISSFKNLPAALFGRTYGLFFGAPILLVALLFGMRPYWRQSRKEAILYALICLCLIAFISMYSPGVPGFPGNRYLMSVVALGAIPLSFAVREAFVAGGTER